MEVTAWTLLFNAMNAQEERRPFSMATVRRIAAFAQPHRRYLTWFLLLSVVTAVSCKEGDLVQPGTPLLEIE